MWRVRAFTVDDAYISFRYARNLANGLGLVFNAVSYTHLRAHETVLDLVCRLLLEKKKKATITQ